MLRIVLLATVLNDLTIWYLVSRGVCLLLHGDLSILHGLDDLLVCILEERLSVLCVARTLVQERLAYGV